MSAKEEEGSLYEAGRAVVQARAIAAMVNAILECLPPDTRAVAVIHAQRALASDPGALKILGDGLRIDRGGGK